MKRFLILSAISVATLFLILQLLNTQPAPKTIAHTQTIEWFGEHIVLNEMTTIGQLKQTITADKLLHYTPDNITDLWRVKIILFPTKKGDRRWELQSDKGRLFHSEAKQEITRIDLWHNVVLFSPASETQDAVTINTSTLAIFPEKEYAHTDQYTTIHQVGQTLSGMGMEVFFDKQTFHLINQVSSVHENTN
jgi:lipopolysaccharide export system protein LptC